MLRVTGKGGTEYIKPCEECGRIYYFYLFHCGKFFLLKNKKESAWLYNESKRRKEETNQLPSKRRSRKTERIILIFLSFFFLLFHFIPLFLFLIRSLYLPKFDYLFHWICLLSSLYLQLLCISRFGIKNFHLLFMCKR